VPGAHVDLDASKSNDIYLELHELVKGKMLTSLRIRGVKLDYKSPDGKMTFVRIEVICSTEEGIVNFIKLVKILKDKVTFTYVRIMGDNFENQSASHRIPVTQKGFDALIEGFSLNLFYMVNEFRFYNFYPELTPLLAFASSLVNNPTITTLGFARNQLSEDTCAAIL
jgi:hypothetical protein